MSQAGDISATAGPVPPYVATQFVTNDNSPAIPSGNQLNIVGGFVSTDNNNGIQTDGSGGSNTLTVQLTNRIIGTGTTDTVTTTLDLVSFDLGSTAGVYYFEGSLIGFDKTSVQGASYPFQFSARTDGTATGGLEIGSNFINEIEEPGFTYNNIDVQILPGTNTLLVRVVGNGINTVDWDTILTYRFVS